MTPIHMKKAYDYRLPDLMIDRIKEETKWSREFINKACEEYKRFMIMAGEGDMVSPSKVVDEIWHTHILFTKDYYNFCNSCFGRVIHHEPFDKPDQKLYDTTLKLYFIHFGVDAPEEFWGIDPRDKTIIDSIKSFFRKELKKDKKQKKKKKKLVKRSSGFCYTPAPVAACSSSGGDGGYSGDSGSFGGGESGGGGSGGSSRGGSSCGGGCGGGGD